MVLVRYFTCLFLVSISFGCSHLKRFDKFSITEKNFHVQTMVYKPNEPNQNTVIIIPPTGGVNYIDKSYAKQLQKKGAQVIIVTSWTGDQESNVDLKLHQRLHARAMKAIGLVLETIPSDQTVSILGASLGGIYTSVAVEVFDRIDKAFVIAAGVPIPDVISVSNNSGMEELRKKRKKQMNFKTSKEYADAIHSVFELDPLDLPTKHENKKLGMIVLLDDKSVPTVNQIKLKEHWKPVYYKEFHLSHFWGIVKTWWSYSDEVTDFLVK